MKCYDNNLIFVVLKVQKSNDSLYVPLPEHCDMAQGKSDLPNKVFSLCKFLNAVKCNKEL